MLGRNSSLLLGATAISCLLLAQPASADSTERTSLTNAGNEASGASFFAHVSADGRFVSFYSNGTDLVTDDTNGRFDVFVRDRLGGTTERVSVSSAGDEGDDDSNTNIISPDGRFVVFMSEADNLVTGSSGGNQNIFLHDRQTGVTELINVSSAEAPASSGSFSDQADISADGRYVVFQSDATNLVDDDTNATYDIFVRDRQAGTTERVSVTAVGAEATGESRKPSISEDGRFVSFYSGAPDLVPDDTNAESDVFVKDLQTGAVERVSVDSDGNQANDRSEFSAISADGRFVAIASQATNLVAGADAANTFDIFVKDRQTGAIERVSVDSNGVAPDAEALRPAISADGRFVAFDSAATNLVPGDTNGVNDIFVHDRLTGITERVNVDSAGNQATGDSSFFVDLSGDGRLAVFQSSAGVANLVPDDTNGAADTFLRDRGLQPDGRNDFLADFGGAGTWQRLNDTAWQKIHNGSPAVMAAGDFNGNFQDEAIVSFGAAGLWVRYDNMTWVKLHNGVPQRFVTGDFDGNGMDDLVVDFGGAGIWVRKNDSAWAKLHNATSQELAVGDLDGNGKDELIADFGGAGLWVRYNDSTWAKRHNASPVRIAAGYLDGDNRAELIADFGAAGLWVRYNDKTWAKLHNATSQGIVTGDMDGNDKEELIVDFGGAGLWVRYNNATWVKRHNASPQRMIATDLDGGGKADLVADFGPAGLWVKHNNGPWTKIHNATTQDLAAGGFD